MATLTASPTQGKVGQPVSISGTEFADGGTVTLEVQEEGFSSEIVADASGAFGTDDVADHATTTLTSSGVNVSPDDEIVIGAVTYVFKADPGAVANQVAIGSDAEETLANLKKAINLTGEAGAGKDYGTGTVIHPTVFAGDADATTLKLHAKTGGTGGNTLASTTTAVTYSFPGATFNSGTPGSAATGISPIMWMPTRAGTFHIVASDGTNSASLRYVVFT